MNLMRYFTFFICFGFILLVPGTKAAIILKTKNRKALIHLEGIKTKRGAYFSVENMQGRKKGIIQIKKVANHKAIGVLKYGKISKNWSLEPMSEKRAIAVQQKVKNRKTQIIRLAKAYHKRQQVEEKRLIAQKQKKLAQKKRAIVAQQKAKKKKAQIIRLAKAYHKRQQVEEKRLIAQKQKQKKLAQKKRAIRRKLAAFEGESTTQNFAEDNSSQLNEVLFFDVNQEQQSEFIDHKNKDQRLAKKYYDRNDLPGIAIKKFAVGLNAFVEYDLMQVNPPRGQPSYLASGIGFGSSFLFDLDLNRFMGVEGVLGGKKFSVFSSEQKCGTTNGCRLDIYYLLLSGSLKLYLMDFSGHRFWLAGGGTFLQPIAYSNNILSEKSFSSMHGSIGGGLGINFNWDDIMMPVSIRGVFQMPATKTTLTGSVNAQIGLSYKF